LQDNDPFGPFSDSAAARGSDPFSFPSTLADEDSTFDSFGDFGDFQSARDGEFTPTTGSWTFASDSSTSDEWSEGFGHADGREMDKLRLTSGEGNHAATDGARA